VCAKTGHDYAIVERDKCANIRLGMRQFQFQSVSFSLWTHEALDRSREITLQLPHFAACGASAVQSRFSGPHRTVGSLHPSVPFIAPVSERRSFFSMVLLTEFGRAQKRSIRNADAGP
jgi:hypothetical protein